MANETTVINRNIHFLRQGVELLERLNEHQYTRTDSPHFKSSIGEHMRHIIEHFDCFFEGLDGRIDYDARRRDKQIENNRSTAVEKFRETIGKLNTIAGNPEKLDQVIKVKSNIDSRSDSSEWSRSTPLRELQYLLSHTVHHFALIAVTLVSWEVVLPESFGIAPSTIEFRKKQDNPPGSVRE